MSLLHDFYNSVEVDRSITIEMITAMRPAGTFPTLLGFNTAVLAYEMFHPDTSDLGEMVRMYNDWRERCEHEDAKYERTRPKYAHDFVSKVNRVIVHDPCHIDASAPHRFHSIHFQRTDDRLWTYMGTRYTEGPTSFEVKTRDEAVQLALTVIDITGKIKYMSFERATVVCS